MEALTPAERRGALVVVCLLALGAGHDLWRASRPLPALGHVDRPRTDTAPPPGGGTEIATAPPDAPGRRTPLELNRATAAELDALPGIGPVLAARIVAYRDGHGPYLSPEDLLAVRGIGPRLLSRIAPFMRVDGLASPEVLPGSRPIP